LKMTFLLTFLLFTQALEAPGRASQVDVKKVFARMAEGPLEDVWEAAAELVAAGEDIIADLEDGLSSRSVKVRLGCADALLALGEPEEAEKALRGIADSKESRKVRTAALVLLRTSLDEKLIPVLKRLAEEDPDPYIRIEAARTLWEVSEDTKAPKLLERFLEAGDRDLRIKAALALGEIGYVQSLTKRILARLSREPTDEGRRAALILQVERLAREGDSSQNPFGLGKEELLKERESRIRELERENELLRRRKLERSSEAYPLLSWILKTIKENYVEPEKAKEEDLRVGAAKGMVSVLDRFSSFMNVRETKDFMESISGSYTGIGAQISQDRDTGILTVVRPLAGSPARKAGLKPQDKIIEIDGVPTKGKTMSEIVGLLKGEPYTEVKLKIARRGWKEPREFTVTRREIRVETTHARLLPGAIGYIRLDNFGENSYEEVKKALSELKKQGMQGIILDLRGNPGGLLRAAVDIVDLFIADDPRPIVSQKGKTGSKEELSRDAPPQYLTEPLVILVDKTSASASEIVSGALQDFDHRATLVGGKTFGKGSVQKIYSVPGDVAALIGGRAALRLTVQYYYLPSGRCIHTRRDSKGAVVAEGGVRPDIEVKQPTVTLWKAHEFETLSELKEFKDYVDGLLRDGSDNKDFEIVEKILYDGDGGDPYRYPGFKEFYLLEQLDEKPARIPSYACFARPTAKAVSADEPLGKEKKREGVSEKTREEKTGDGPGGH